MSGTASDDFEQFEVDVSGITFTTRNGATVSANALLVAGIAQSGMDHGLVVATNSIERGGRANDVAAHPGPLSEEEPTAGLATASLLGT